MHVHDPSLAQSRASRCYATTSSRSVTIGRARGRDHTGACQHRSVPEPLADALASLRPLLLDADVLVKAVAAGRRRGALAGHARAELRPVDRAPAGASSS